MFYKVCKLAGRISTEFRIAFPFGVRELRLEGYTEGDRTPSGAEFLKVEFTHVICIIRNR